MLANLSLLPLSPLTPPPTDDVGYAVAAVRAATVAMKLKRAYAGLKKARAAARVAEATIKQCRASGAGACPEVTRNLTDAERSIAELTDLIRELEAMSKKMRR